MCREGARCGQMWTCALERCVSFPVEEQEWNRNMSMEQSEKEACGDTLCRAHLIFIPVPHSPEAGDQTYQLYQLHSSSLQREKKILPGWCEPVGWVLGAPCQTVHSKACFIQSLSNSMTLAHHLLPQSRGGLLGVSAKLVL